MGSFGRAGELVRRVLSACRMRALWLLLSLLTACGEEGGGLLPDAGPTDSGAADTGVPGDLWSWCPSPADAIADPAFTYRATVTEEADFCAYGNAISMEDLLRRSAMLQLVPGEYPLPASEGQFAYRLPMCLLDREGNGSMLGAAGNLQVTFEEFFGDTTLKRYLLEQPITFASESLTFRADINIWERTGMGTPELVLDENPRHGDYPDTGVFYATCRGSDCFQEGSGFYPCPSAGQGDETTISFARGSLTVSTHIFSFAVGPSSPAALTRARGQLDGTSFDEDDYFQLAHRPDHHNHGGGFLVMFDQPIGGACGIKAQIPSRDGSFWVDRPAAWTIDCDLQTIEELSGVEPGM